MIEVNLLPKEMFKKQNNQWKVILPVALCLFALSIGIGLSATQFWQIRQYEKQIDQLEIQLQSAGKFNKDFNQWKQEKKKIQLKEQWRQSLNKERIQPEPLLLEISQTVPEDAWLTKISLQSKQVNIEGMGLSYDSLAAFLTDLKDKKCFQEEPTLVNSQADSLEDQNIPALVSFKIEGHLAPQEAVSP